MVYPLAYCGIPYGVLVVRLNNIFISTGFVCTGTEGTVDEFPQLFIDGKQKIKDSCVIF